MVSDEAQVTNIREVRGKDGSTAYEITGGKHGAGETSYYMSKESFAAAEKEGRQALQDTLKRGIDTTLESAKEQH